MSEHAKYFGASAAHKWIPCVGSVALEAQYPNTSSAAADEGTAAHEMAERILRGASDADLIGKRAKNGVEWTAEMREHIQIYIDKVHNLKGCGELLVEERVDYSHHLGVDGDTDGFGTSDVVILRGTELCVADLKYGKGVRVDVENNPQLMLYALGAYDRYKLVADIDTIRMVIIQPRIDHISEWTCSVDDLLRFAHAAKVSAQEALAIVAGTMQPAYTPGEKQCRFCRGKATCPALRAEAEALFEVIPDELTEDEQLSVSMQKADMVEAWAKAVRAEVERRLTNGKTVPGFKMVQGKNGARKWVSEDGAASSLHAAGFADNQIFKRTLISPTDVEKLVKQKLVTTDQWAALQSEITQTKGAPSVAPESDKRPALVLASADFVNLDKGVA